MYSSRPTGRLTGWQLLSIIVGVVLIVAAWQRLTESTPSLAGADLETPTLSAQLTRRDVLPTLTPDARAPLRQIIFPDAQVVAPLVKAVRNGDSWETRYLGASVGHLEGTSWLNDPGGNIVLAGHVEDAEGKPGPFAHLFETKPGELVILRDGDRETSYSVTTVERLKDDDMSLVAQDGHRRLTLITCSDWDYKSGTYLTRLIVVALPILVPLPAQAAAKR